jgi:hypothetical protein
MTKLAIKSGGHWRVLGSVLEIAQDYRDNRAEVSLVLMPRAPRAIADTVSSLRKVRWQIVTNDARRNAPVSMYFSGYALSYVVLRRRRHYKRRPIRLRVVVTSKVQQSKRHLAPSKSVS